MTERLAGRKALITGASRGIGRATALLFAREGADICINYSKREKEAKDLQLDIQKLGVHVVVSKADVGDRGQVARMVDLAVTELGRVDILINNAGVFRSGSALRLDESELDEMFQTNVKGIINCVSEVARQMIERKMGKIVNIGSNAGMGTAFPGTSPYAITKGAVIILKATRL